VIEAPKKIDGRFYATGSGRKPVREWLMDLSREDRRQVGIDIQRIEFGWPLGMPYCRSLGQGLWEVRSNLAGGRIARVIFFIHEREMILLHGFEKKTQKTPTQDIALALARKRGLE
jgi:phage-related protein